MMEPHSFVLGRTIVTFYVIMKIIGRGYYCVQR